MIDDDPGILEAFMIVFQQAGYKISVFNDADLILKDKFDEPDIFIIDKQLAGVDGIDVCRYLKSRVKESSTPIIIFSASPMMEANAQDAGADGFIEKPFKTTDLLRMVRRLIV